ncbi:MAG: hypothetical protein JWM41_4895 [Gemmatimonadetes bacterium]|nr:hypothetical protein [Gemmatimonadota bacterium]
MTANTKSIVLLAATLVVGFALGLFADSTLVRRRRDRIGQLRRPPGFVAHMERVIEPRNDAQRDSIRPLLEHVAQQNGQAIRDANVRLRAVLDSMRVSLAPMLDSAQRGRLATELDRMPEPFRPGGPGRGGRGGRGGPPP